MGYNDLTLSWWRPLSYRNQSINLQSKSVDWFLYDNGFRHERVNADVTTGAEFLTQYFRKSSCEYFLANIACSALPSILPAVNG